MADAGPTGVALPQVNIRHRLENDFTFHPVKPELNQAARYEDIRAYAKQFAKYLVLATPPGREQSLALTNLEQVVFWANAAIARNE